MRRSPRCSGSRRRTRRTCLIDSTAVTLDFNIVKKRYRKADLVDKDYAWAYSITNGYYLGYNLTLVGHRAPR
ncbi:MAG: hypothetical protein HQQ74_00090 [Methanoculleus bourgensis]|uniref:Uncharacterized protein n=1 Tax=Methanoculleus bourgensis TaxID=83986 RepID=A0A8T7H9Y4_9EURY|nr:hypothetical protein [Methanoculleus bourgensis]